MPSIGAAFCLDAWRNTVIISSIQRLKFPCTGRYNAGHITFSPSDTMIIHSDSLNAAFEQERIVAPQTASPNEESIERALRPKAFGEYVGQDRVREQLEIFISAAKKRSESLDHVLLFGPPGLVKTTLAHIMTHEMGVQMRQTSGPVLERARSEEHTSELQSLMRISYAVFCLT